MSLNVGYPERAESERRTKMKNKHQILYLATLSILAAMTLLLGFTPIGMLNLGFIYISVLSLPVIIGTLTLGLRGGLVLGLCFGTVSFIKALNAPSALVAPLLSKSILYVVLLCYIPRVMIPVMLTASSHWVKRLNEKAALLIRAVIGSMTNTLLYMGGMLLLYVLSGTDTAALLAAMAGVVFGAGLAEAAVCAVLSYPVIRGLQKAGLLESLKNYKK